MHNFQRNNQKNGEANYDSCSLEELLSKQVAAANEVISTSRVIKERLAAIGVNIRQPATAAAASRASEANKPAFPPQVPKLAVAASGGRDDAAAATFFDRLPNNGFARDEEAMRDALMIFLERWDKNKGPPTLSTAALLPAIREARAAFLPNGVSLKDWIERRIGLEIETFTNGAGAACIRLAGSSNGVEAAVKEDVPAANGEAFFDGLPGDGFTREEEAMRDALMSFLEGWDRTKGPPTLSAASFLPAVREARAAFLPKGASLKDWVERRIGAEVETFTNDAGAACIRLVNAAGGAPAAGKDEISAAGKDAFFDGLPTDGFTRDEEAMRDALNVFIETWDKSKGGPPTLSGAGSLPAIREARAAFLPKGVSLKEWIERRIGAEVECAPFGSNTAIGFAGELDVSGVPGGGGRRPRSRGPTTNGKGGGKSDGGKGKGKSKGKGRAPSSEPPRKRAR